MAVPLTVTLVDELVDEVVENPVDELVDTADTGGDVTGAFVTERSVPSLHPANATAARTRLTRRTRTA